MRKKNSRLVQGLVVWIFSFFLLLWCGWPIKTIRKEIVFQPGKLIILPEVGASLFNSKEQSFPEERRLILEWKPILRKGDLSNVKLSFIGQKPAAIDFGNQPSFEDNYISVYELNSISAESRIELNGPEVDPGGLSGQVLSEGQDIQFTWTLLPGKDGTYEGSVWFYLKLFPINGNPSFIEQAISSQTIDIKVISLLGLNSNFWRFLGVLGLGIGIAVLKFEKIHPLMDIFWLKLKGKRNIP